MKHISANELREGKMINWKSASIGDLKRLEAIKILFGQKRGHLVDLIFHSRKPQLSSGPEKLKEKMGYLSSGEQILVLIAMDIWGTYGGIHFDDLLTLSPDALESCIKSLAFLKKNGW